MTASSDYPSRAPQTSTSIPISDDPDELPDVRDLAELHYLRADATEKRPPPFGSRTWLDLAEDDPQREASLVLSAYAAWAAFHGLGAPIASARREEQHRADVDHAIELGRSPDLDVSATVRAAEERRAARIAAANVPSVRGYRGRRAEGAA